MAEGNRQADALSRFSLICSAFLEAQNFHQQWHVNARTLCKRYGLSRREALQIIRACPLCITSTPRPSEGVNPRGLYANDVWQMDVTHFPPFGRQSCLHVTVDTFSRVIMATAAAKENAVAVQDHLLHCFANWGIPRTLKTDNGPAYTSQAFAKFLALFSIRHVTGIPYNPQGQGIIERANGILKATLIKQKGGIGKQFRSPKTHLAIALFTLNFLTLKTSGLTAAELHASGTTSGNTGFGNISGQKSPVPAASSGSTTPTAPELVMWKDVVTGQWKGPDPVLRKERGAVLVAPSDVENIWIPTRLTRQFVPLPGTDAGYVPEINQPPVTTDT